MCEPAWQLREATPAASSAAQSTDRQLSKDETIPPTGRRPVAALHQDAPGVAQIRAYALAVTLAQVT